MGNNQELVLSINELLFLASEAGADEFFGVGDPFLFMSVEQIRTTLENAGALLDEKGYGDMDFDGKFQMKNDVLSLIRPCAFCDAYLTVENGSSNERVVYYFAEDIFMKLWKCKDGWHLKPADKEEELANLCNEFTSDVYNMVTAQRKVSSKYLKKLKKAVANKEEEEQSKLLAQLENDEMKTIVLDMVSENTETSSLILSDFTADVVRAILHLNTEHGAILVTETEDTYSDEWWLLPASSDRMKSEIEMLLGRISV